MAQSALTVTPPNPTPPTNMSSLGTTPPTAPLQPVFDDGITRTPTNGGLNENNPPAGPSASPQAFAAKVASVDNANFPSVDHEGLGTEVVATWGVQWPTNVNVFNPAGPLKAVSTGPAYTTTPNASHPSYLSGGAVPTITAGVTGVVPNSPVSGAGTIAITVTGTNYNRSSVVYIDGVAQNTNYVSATSLTVANAPKRATAGTRSVTVVNGGGPTSAPYVWTFS